jgi:hypothetical protein
MILRLHAPETAGNPELAQALQKEVLDVFESDHAWGLTEGLLRHPVSSVTHLHQTSGYKSNVSGESVSLAPGCSVFRCSKWTYQNISTMVSLRPISIPACGRLDTCTNRETLPPELQPVLLQQTLDLTSQAASPDSPYKNENSIVLRKLFSSVSYIALFAGFASLFSNIP